MEWYVCACMHACARAWVCTHVQVYVCVCVYILNNFLSTLLFLNILAIHVQDIPLPNTKDTVLLIPHLILLSLQILLLVESFHFSHSFRTHQYIVTPPTLHRHAQHLASSAVSSYFQFCHPVFCTSGHPYYCLMKPIMDLVYFFLPSLSISLHLYFIYFYTPNLYCFCNIFTE